MLYFQFQFVRIFRRKKYKTKLEPILNLSLSESVGRLYDNYEGLLDQFALFWGEVARTFAGSMPTISKVYDQPSYISFNVR